MFTANIYASGLIKGYPLPSLAQQNKLVVTFMVKSSFLKRYFIFLGKTFWLLGAYATFYLKCIFKTFEIFKKFRKCCI
jgi:hypothetical protein